MKKFVIPEKYRSSIIGSVKEWRKSKDPRKQDFSPTHLDLGPLEVVLPRHFGFCYGVENAIEISYKAIEENPGKRIFLLSQMIHNPAVNDDLESRGIQFIMDTEGHQFIGWDEISSDDVVIIPAFGTTLEIEQILKDKGVETRRYNTTCPFVEKVWKRSSEIGGKGYTNIIHGKHKHEETRATFSHSAAHSASVIVRDLKEAERLAEYMKGNKSREEFEKEFAGKYSVGFDPSQDLKKVGVVNQTTMLATETQEIADYFKKLVVSLYGDDAFADTRDTLCYATNDNQDATMGALNSNADLALVIGGYNSSNTSQLVTILSEKMPVYFIKDAEEIVSENSIFHFVYAEQKRIEATDWLPKKDKVKIVITSGASCPDPVVEAVVRKVQGFFPNANNIENVLEELIGME
ncbi:MAG: 4-hydroxy-3-methylbut-2-enyl diphosphate reductase [Flavobacteriales bacterium]|jgi:4-hydroxy-3-methylbut-2-enyl diphosphate reductase